MKIIRAEFENFRNIKSYDFKFSDGMNIIFGQNAHGKTNVLEGIYMFAGGRSFRGAKDREMIKHGEHDSFLKIKYSDSVRENEMTLSFSDEKRREGTRNNVKIGKMSDFIGNFRSVIFSPENLAIVKQEPSFRRSFLDFSISQLRPMYVFRLGEYRKIIEQRNTLIKKCKEEGEKFGDMGLVISRKAAACSAYLTCVRAKYLKKIFECVKEILNDMTFGNEQISYEYINSLNGYTDAFDNEEEILKKYEKRFCENTEREISAGMTLYGAHRDDFVIKLNGYDARTYASQGQQRSIALSLILGQGEIVKDDTGEYPVFLFDDVFSELDRSRKAYLISKLKSRQVIATACDENDFSGEDMINNAVKIRVDNGMYTYI